MRKMVTLCVIMLLVISLTGCQGEVDKGMEKINLTVSAATSLKDALEEIKAEYIKEHPEVSVTYNFAASGTLQRQIEEGAMVDVFISANKEQMDALDEKGLIVETSRTNLLNNELVLIIGKDGTISGFQGLLDRDVERISIGTPEYVPAGKYARDTLISLDIWGKIQNKLVLAKDVRQVLIYVASGNVDAGIVYRSDVMTGDGIQVVATAPSGSHETIVYPMAIIKGTKQVRASELFVEYLLSANAIGIFEKYGFKVIDE